MLCEQNLIEQVTAAFENDPDLVFAYEDLNLFMSKQKFIRKHISLLKSYSKDMRPKTLEQRQAVSFLCRSRQRKLITELISGRTPMNERVVQALSEAENDSFPRMDGFN